MFFLVFVVLLTMAVQNLNSNLKYSTIFDKVYDYSPLDSHSELQSELL